MKISSYYANRGQTISRRSPGRIPSVLLAAAFGIAATAQADECVPTPSGLISWWAAAGTANDTVDGNDGVLLNGAAFATGKVGQAFSFDGTNDYIRIPNRPNLRFTNALTVEAWLYPTRHGEYHEIVSKWGTVQDGQVSWGTTVGPDGNAAIGVCADGHDGVRAAVGSTNSLPLNQWTHFAGTYDGSALRVYINGICENQVAFSQGIFSGTNDLAIGAVGGLAPGSILSPFAGRIDEPSVYSRALSAAEIQAIFTAGSAGKCPPPPPAFSNGLVAYYPFNGNVRDGSGNGNDGVLHGTDWKYSADRFGNPNSLLLNTTSNPTATYDGTYVAVPRSASLDFNSDFTLAVWVSFRSGLTYYVHNLISNGPDTNSANLRIVSHTDSQGLDYLQFIGNHQTGEIHTLAPHLNDQWFHFVAVRSGNNVSLFRDGSLLVNSGITAAFLHSPEIWLGRHICPGYPTTCPGSYPLFGGIDDVRMYNRALPPDEVFQLYYQTANQQSPVITSQPQSRTNVVGSSLQFSVSASSPTPLSYQWRRNGENLPGFTNRVCTLVGVFTNDVGDYSVTVSNVFGGTTSSNAVLAVREVSAPAVLAGPITNIANGHLYFLLQQSSWVEAEAAAVALGGHLATVRSQAENAWLFATFGNYQGITRDLLIGLFDDNPLSNSGNRIQRQGEFRWVSREPVAYTNWFSDEPHNAGDTGEFYSQLWGFSGAQSDGYWDDIRADAAGDKYGIAEVTLKPVIVLTQPATRTAVATSSISFAASVSGLAPLTFQWRKGEQILPAQTNRICTLVGMQSSDAGDYSLVVSNGYGVVTGLVATLTVLPFTPPAVLAGPLTNPANDHLYYLLDQSSWLEAEAAAVALGGHLATIRNQVEQDWVYSTFWNYGGVARGLHIGLYDPDPIRNSPIRGERLAEFIWASGESIGYLHWRPIEPNNSSEMGEFYVHMWSPAWGADWFGYWNDLNDARSHPNYGVAEVIVAPTITLQPTNQFVLAGSNVVLAVSATGSKPLSYQWRLNGTNLPGATQSVLSLTNVSAQHRGAYDVLVSNGAASLPSDPAFLDVRYALAYGNGELMLGSNYTFIGSVDLQLWSVFPNANIFYTLDGSAPTFASGFYAGPFTLNRTATLRVIAYSADFLQAAESPPISLKVIPIYTLNLISPGGGTVTANPPTGPYVSNSVVTLTPQPSNGWTFLEWRGDVSGANPTADVTMRREKTVQAIFGTSLSNSVAGNGSVAVDPALPLYPFGTVVRLTAIPQVGSYFAVWGNAASGNTNPLSFTVTSAAPTVSSLFTVLAVNQQSLTVIPDGFGKVTVTPRANVFTTGASVTLNAIPDPGQQFLAWSGDATGTQNPLPLSMTASKTITATFTRKPSLTVVPPLDGFFGAGFRFTLHGEFGQTNQIETSTNLVDWTQLGSITNKFGTAQFTDTAATNLPHQFYRAVTY